MRGRDRIPGRVLCVVGFLLLLLGLIGTFRSAEEDKRRRAGSPGLFDGPVPLSASPGPWLPVDQPIRGYPDLAAEADGAMRRNERGLAASLLRCVAGLESVVAARMMARRWLLAHALTEGRWLDVMELAREQAELAAWGVALATRLRLPIDKQLRRTARETEPFAPDALKRFAAGPAVAPPPNLPRGDRDVLSYALAGHTRLLGLPPWALNDTELRRAAYLWTAVGASPVVAANLTKRALALGVREDGARLLDTLLHAIEADLVELVRRRPGRLVTGLPPGPLTNAFRRVTNERAALFEGEAARLAELWQSPPRPLRPGERWVSWVGVAESWARLGEVATPEAEFGAFARVANRLCDGAVAAANRDKDRRAAHAVFRFLAAEGARVGLSAHLELFQKNAQVTA